MLADVYGRPYLVFRAVVRHDAATGSTPVSVLVKRCTGACHWAEQAQICVMPQRHTVDIEVNSNVATHCSISRMWSAGARKGSSSCEPGSLPLCAAQYLRPHPRGQFTLLRLLFIVGLQSFERCVQRLDHRG